MVASRGSENDLMQGMNPAQMAAVQAPPAPIIVLAGPGSGKTRVLTSRIGFLMQRGAAASSIVAVTFTNKAANEMRQRIKNVLGIKHDSELQVTVGTFHRVCLDILREFGHLVGLESNFLIFNADQQKELVIQAMENLGINKEVMHPNTLRFAISNLKSQNLAPEEADKFQQRDGAVWNPKFVKTVRNVYELYQEELIRSNAVDFDDILLVTLRLLQEQPAVTAGLRQRWHHILVDEWQDTNVPQYSLIQLLAAPSQGRAVASVFVVGDADQSIYGWRGADFTNVERFEKEFAASRILLEHNYRSTSTIVEAAQSVIERNTGRVEKKMLSDKPSGALVHLHQMWDDQEEASFVARHAKKLVEAGACVGFREIAVMYRTNQQSRIMEEMFVRNGVPYQLIGATKFYERKEVKDLLAYLRVLANPDDSQSLMRIINTPARGIGKATLDRLVGLAAQWGCSVFQALARLSKARRDASELASAEEEVEGEDLRGASSEEVEEVSGSSEDPRSPGPSLTSGGGGREFSVDDLDEAMSALNAALDTLPHTSAAEQGGKSKSKRSAKAAAEQQLAPELRAAMDVGLKDRALNSLLSFWDVMEILRQGAALSTPEETVQLVADVTEFKEHLMKDETFDDRWANVGELVKASARVSEPGIDGLVLFLEDVALVAGEDNELEESIELDIDVKKDPRVKLMTLHSSKGLEFDVVFMVGMVEGKLPHEKCSKSVDQVEEERRLAYVGMTRARERLYMTWHKAVYGRSMGADREDADTWLQPSRFLKDIPAHLRQVISYDKAAVEARLEEPAKADKDAFDSFSPPGARGRRGGAARGARRGRGMAVTRPLQGREVADMYNAAAVRGRGARGTQVVASKGGTAPRPKGPFDD